MTESELLSIVESEERTALGYLDSELSIDRQRAMEYYLGEPFGNEVEGRSQVVSRDVADTVEWIMPSLMRIFMSTDRVVQFEPQGPEDMENAEQATQYINYIFTRQNPGFLILYTGFKDALLQKNCFVKVYAENYDERKREEYQGLLDDEFYMLTSDEGVEVEAHTEYEVEGARAHDVVLRRKQTYKKICIENVPPEEVIVNRQAKSQVQKCRFIAHRTLKTVSELRAMGFEDVEDLAGHDDQEYNTERIARWKKEDHYVQTRNENPDPAMREVWVTEAYIRVDYDDDGFAELRKVIKAGNRILDNEEVDTIPFVTGTPILMPHKLIGLSIADLVMDIQLIKSALLRQTLDNAYLLNNGRFMALEGMVNLSDLVTSRPGGVVRVKTFDAVKRMDTPALAAGHFGVLDYMDKVRDGRTGVRQFLGLDPDVLRREKSATESKLIADSAGIKIELIARIFAETFVKDLFYAVLELVQKHQNRKQIVRLNNRFVPVDPTEWKNKFDMSVNVGLGTGDVVQNQAALGRILELQLQYLQIGLPLVQPMNLYRASTDFANAAMPKNGGVYFTNPAEIPPQPPRPDPEIVKTQMEIEADMQKAREKNAAGLQKTMIQAQVKSHEHDKDIRADLTKHVMDKRVETAQGEAERSAQVESQRPQIIVDSNQGLQMISLAISKLAEGNQQVAQAVSQSSQQTTEAVGQAAQVMSQAAAQLSQAAQVLMTPTRKRVKRDRRGNIEEVEEIRG